MPGSDERPRGQPVGLDRAHHLEPGRRLRRRLQHRHLAQPVRPADLERPVHGHPRAVPGDLRGRDRRPRRDARGPRRTRSSGTPRTTPWVPVAAGTTAVSKVTYDYSQVPRQSTGTTASRSPSRTPIYPIAQGFDLAYDADKAQDRDRARGDVPAVPRDLQGLPHHRRRQARGLRRLLALRRGPDRGVRQSRPAFAMPWEVLAAMDDLVFEQRRAAYSDTAAARYSVPWLSLVMRRDAGLVDRTLRELEPRRDRPAGRVPGRRPLAGHPGGGGRPATRRPRSGSTTHDHLVISQGPFFLSRFDPPAQFAQLDAFRDPTYPFTRGRLRARARRPRWPSTPPADPIVTAGQDAADPGHGHGPGTLALRYLLLDPANGQVVQSGRRGPGRDARRVRGDAPRRRHGHAVPGALPARASAGIERRDRALIDRSGRVGRCEVHAVGGSIAVAHLLRHPGRAASSAVPVRGPVLLVVTLGATGYSDRILDAVSRRGDARPAHAARPDHPRPGRSWRRRSPPGARSWRRSYGLDQPWYAAPARRWSRGSSRSTWARRASCAASDGSNDIVGHRRWNGCPTRCCCSRPRCVITAVVGLGGGRLALDARRARALDRFVSYVAARLVRACPAGGRASCSSSCSASRCAVLPTGRHVQRAAARRARSSGLLDLLWHAILPILTLVLVSVGPSIYVIRTMTLDVAQEDHVTLARAKGMPERSSPDATSCASRHHPS